MYCFSTSNPHFFVLLCAFGAGLNKQHLVFARGSVFVRLCQHGEQREAVRLEEEGGGALSECWFPHGGEWFGSWQALQVSLYRWVRSFYCSHNISLFRSKSQPHNLCVSLSLFTFLQVPKGGSCSLQLLLLFTSLFTPSLVSHILPWLTTMVNSSLFLAHINGLASLSWLDPDGYIENYWLYWQYSLHWKWLFYLKIWARYFTGSIKMNKKSLKKLTALLICLVS